MEEFKKLFTIHNDFTPEVGGGRQAVSGQAGGQAGPRTGCLPEGGVGLQHYPSTSKPRGTATDAWEVCRVLLARRRRRSSVAST